MTGFKRYLSAIEGVTFPAFPQRSAAELLAALAQLEQSQWWAPERLKQVQKEQLGNLLSHAMQNVPYYRDRLNDAGFTQQKIAGLGWSDSLWQALPTLKRQQVQDLGERLQSQKMPKGHGKRFMMQSSGSTGRPVQVLGSGLTRFYWDVSTLRDNSWHQHDFMQRFAAIRPDRLDTGVDRNLCRDWGRPVNMIYPSVPTLVINSRVDVHQQLRWLEEYQPVYLLSLPSNLRELLRVSKEEGFRIPSLQQVRCFGETVPSRLRDSVREVWGVGLTDMYSSTEVGYMALQCPDHEHYHIQSETMYVEVLDDNDQPCKPGEIGRVVVTPLHNFAMPLIRYEVGDYAEVGEPCSCGRGLPVLKRIVGRTRNMVRTPEGKCYWPSFPVVKLLKIAPIRQLQLRQVSLDTIDVSLAMDGELTADQKEQLVQRLQGSLNYPFNITFTIVDSIAVQKNGKYEDFISML